jgi:hypothetical protein
MRSYSQSSRSAPTLIDSLVPLPLGCTMKAPYEGYQRLTGVVVRHARSEDHEDTRPSAGEAEKDGEEADDERDRQGSSADRRVVFASVFHRQVLRAVTIVLAEGGRLQLAMGCNITLDRVSERAERMCLLRLKRSLLACREKRAGNHAMTPAIASSSRGRGRTRQQERAWRACYGSTTTRRRCGNT